MDKRQRDALRMSIKDQMDSLRSRINDCEVRSRQLEEDILLRQRVEYLESLCERLGASAGLIAGLTEAYGVPIELSVDVPNTEAWLIAEDGRVVRMIHLTVE